MQELIWFCKLPSHELADLYKLGLGAFKKIRSKRNSQSSSAKPVKRPSQPVSAPSEPKEVIFSAEKLKKVHGRLAGAAFAMADRGNAWDKLFRRLDSNHDRKLDQGEFVDACRGVLDLNEQAFPDNIVESVFKLLDEDGFGNIDVQVCSERVLQCLLGWMEHGRG